MNRIFFIAWKTDFWVYPVFAVLHWGGRLIFIAALLLLAFLMYFTGEGLYSAIHGSSRDASKVSRSTDFNEVNVLGQRPTGPKGKKTQKPMHNDSKQVNRPTKRKQITKM